MRLSYLRGWLSARNLCTLLVTTNIMYVPVLLYTLGSIVVAKLLFSIFHGIWIHVLRPPTNLAIYGAQPLGKCSERPWAIVTGGARGIGFGFVCEGLRQGFNIVVVSLPSEEAQFWNDVRQVFPAEGTKSSVADNDMVRYIGTDVSLPADIVTEILENLDSTDDLRLVIHNVGKSNRDPKLFDEHTPHELDDLINVNLRFASRLTNATIPRLRRSGGTAARCGIIFVSSQAGAMPSSPLVSVYGACKAYLIHLCHTLAVEEYMTRQSPEIPVDVMCVTPGYVAAGRTVDWSGKPEGSFLVQQKWKN